MTKRVVLAQEYQFLKPTYISDIAVISHLKTYVILDSIAKLRQDLADIWKNLSPCSCVKLWFSTKKSKNLSLLENYKPLLCENEVLVVEAHLHNIVLSRFLPPVTKYGCAAGTWEPLIIGWKGFPENSDHFCWWVSGWFYFWVLLVGLGFCLFVLGVGGGFCCFGFFFLASSVHFPTHLSLLLCLVLQFSVHYSLQFLPHHMMNTVW